MNVADTLLVSCGAFSCIFPNRAAALDHLFMTIGNGYEWIDGQLVDVCGREDTPGLTASQVIAAIFDRRRQDKERKVLWEAERERELQFRPQTPKEIEEDAKLDAMIDEIILEERKRREQDPEKYERIQAERAAEHKALLDRMAEDEKWEYCVPDNIDERLKDTNYTNWYPAYAPYSNLINFPDDIQPDWLDAIEETANLVLTNRGTTSAYKEHPGATEKCIAENERIARLALEKVAALRAKS
jgi:hypothetical protein